MLMLYHLRKQSYESSEVLKTLPTYLSHLPSAQKSDIEALIQSHLTLFGDIPTCTTIKQDAYRVAKREVMKKEVSYLLEHGLAKPSGSPWRSPCLVTPKSDGSPRFCTDFHKVNAMTVSNSFPLPHIEDCIDSIGSAAYVSRTSLKYTGKFH